ncbi:MAG: glycosyltransferase, partial [Pseudomonadota bacterium]
QFIHSLRELGAEVTLFPLLPKAEPYAEAYRSLPRDVEVVLPGGLDRLLDFLQARRQAYDTVVISRFHTFNLAYRAVLDSEIWRDSVHLVYDAEALMHERERIRQQLNGQPEDARALSQLQRQEFALANQASRVLAVSEREAQHFRDAGQANVSVVGHSLSRGISQAPFEQRQGLLFVGALSVEASPNVDSLNWFLKRIWPSLKDAIGPDLRLHVIGELGAQSLASVNEPGVVFHGRVGDLDPWYERCRVFVAPTRFAAGIPHKVHEAASAGVPCVLTEILRHQLDWEDGVQALSASSAEAFTVACQRLYQEAPLWQRIRTAANESVRAECSPDQFTKRIQRVLEL